MAGRLKWVKAMLREVIQDGTYLHECSHNGGLQGSLQFIRLLKYNHGESSNQSNSVIQKKRRAAPADSAYKHLQNGNSMKETVASLMNCVHQGIVVDSYRYLNILEGCFKQKDLELVKQVHDCIKKSGLETIPLVVNNLMKCYIGCGRLQNARDLFDNFLNKTIVSWNILVGGYAENGQAEDAIEVYKRFRNEGGQADAITYLTVLKACSNSVALKLGKDIHAHILEDGFQADIRVVNALVSMYAKCASIEDSRAVFDRMERRDVISWNAMISGLAQHGLGDESFSLFLRMQREGFIPNSLTYVSILNPNSSTGAVEWVKEVHAHAIKAGMDTDWRVGSALVNMYIKMGIIADARQVFDKILNRDVICWNVMIGGLAQHGLGLEAFSLFLQMQKEGVTPSAITYVNILNPCSSEGALEWVKKVHAQAWKAGLDVGLRVGSALVQMYGKAGSIADAKQVFEKMQDRDAITWTMMISGLAQHGLGHEAFSMFCQMQREGFKPNVMTYLSLLNPCSSTGALDRVKEIQAHARKAGLDVDVRVQNALIHMYAKAGSVGDARQVFDEMLHRDVVSWSVMINGLAQHGHGRAGLELFEQMKFTGARPSGPLFVAVLSSCSHAGLVDEGRLHFVSTTRDFDIKPDLEHYNCMADIFGRAGHLEEASLFILHMPMKPDLVTWKALLGACRIYNNSKLGERAANECFKLEPMDPSPYVLLSNIYASSGNWDQVSSIRQIMRDRGIRKNVGRCWIEVDNKAHHFVAGDTSHPEAREIHATLNSLFEKLKAEGYNPDTRLSLRETDEEDKESALCCHSEKLAIAYGLMHVTPDKPIQIFKNLRICTDCHTATKFISKITGREIVARDAVRFHLFKDGCCSCGDYW